MADNEPTPFEDGKPRSVIRVERRTQVIVHSGVRMRLPEFDYFLEASGLTRSEAFELATALAAQPRVPGVEGWLVKTDRVASGYVSLQAAADREARYVRARTKAARIKRKQIADRRGQGPLRGGGRGSD